MLPKAGTSSGPVPAGQGPPHSGRRMGLFLSLSLAVLCLGIVLGAGRSRAASQPETPSNLEEICGEISSDTTWTTSQSPYHVTCETALLPDYALEIEPGVEIRFSAGVTLTISGTLHALGTPEQPITFTSELEPPAAGDWGGLRFVGGCSGSQLAGCVVEYATVGVHVYAGPGETVGPVFSDCVVRKSAGHGIMVEGETRGCDAGLAQPTITGCLVENNGRCGVYGYGHGDPINACDETPGSVGGEVSGSQIRQNQDAGICLNAEAVGLGRGEVWLGIEANAIAGNAGHGVYLYGDDRVRPRIVNNLLYRNGGAGLYSDARHQDAELSVLNNTLYGNGGDGVALKRPAAQARLANNIVAGNEGYGLACDEFGVPQAANNDLWDNAAGTYSYCTAGVSDIYEDPLLRAPAGGDFHLWFRSPCVDAGTSDGAPDTDLEGVTRPQGEGVDIGAYELWHQEIYLPVILRDSSGPLDGGAP